MHVRIVNKSGWKASDTRVYDLDTKSELSNVLRVDVSLTRSEMTARVYCMGAVERTPCAVPTGGIDAVAVPLCITPDDYAAWERAFPGYVDIASAVDFYNSRVN